MSKVLELEIKRTGNDGEGIAYINKSPVFIYGAYLNEIVKVRVFKNRRGSYQGEILEIIKPSPYRIAPIYRDNRLNAASNLSHITYNEQLKFKRDTIKFLVNSRLRKLKKEIFVTNTKESPKEIYYRNKVDLPVMFLEGKNRVGLYVRGSNDFIPIDNYITHNEEIDKTLFIILTLMNKHKINAYNERTKSGYISHLSLRVNLENEIMVTFILRKNHDLKKITNDLKKLNKNVISVYKSYVPNLRSNREIFEGDLVLIKGNDSLIMTLDGLKFPLNPTSFFQLNTNQAINLYNEIVRVGNFKKDDIVLDAYSGVGTIASFISPHVKEVVAIESIKAAVNAMEESFMMNNITNVKAITGDVIKVVKYIKKKFDVMVFDPPRSGLGEELVKFILKEEPKKIIYTSCGPESLVRELGLLSEKYTFNEIKVFDMFPQTSQIETITVLNLKSSI